MYRPPLQYFNWHYPLFGSRNPDYVDAGNTYLCSSITCCYYLSFTSWERLTKAKHKQQVAGGHRESQYNTKGFPQQEQKLNLQKLAPGEGTRSKPSAVKTFASRDIRAFHFLENLPDSQQGKAGAWTRRPPTEGQVWNPPPPPPVCRTKPPIQQHAGGTLSRS